MDQLIGAFTCVIRKTNNADDIINNVTALLDSRSDATDISNHDRLGILDFPDPIMQEANVSATTNLSKTELLERAASSPSALDVKEINLLKQRYWLNPTEVETTARSAAQRTLLSVSQDHWKQATDQLKKIRAMLYDDHEEEALWNAEMEEWRRMMDALKQQKKQEVENRLATAQPWVKRLWDEDQGEKNWGYAVFRDPKVVNEEHDSRQGAAIMHAQEATGCGGTIGARWRLQYFDWPKMLTQRPHDHTASESPQNTSYVRIMPIRNDKLLSDQIYGSSKELAADGKKHAQVNAVPEGNTKRDEDTTAELEERFQVLRQHFRTVRDVVPEKQRTAFDMQTNRDALQDGILKNVFLVIDQQCVNSLFSQTGNVDDMWVYAVDPDYIQPTGVSPHEYRGYMRVRLQQLVNNFFDARRFHADEFSMQVLWRAAQASRNQAFVSVKESEQQLWTLSRFVGSALRPEGVARPTVNLR